MTTNSVKVYVGDPFYPEPIVRVNNSTARQVLKTAMTAFEYLAAGWQYVVEQVLPESAILLQKQGELWDCIGVSRETDGSVIYHFKFKDSYFRAFSQNRISHELLQKSLEIFPATEPYLPRADYFTPTDIFLGFSFDQDETGAYLYLPDPKTIEMRYAKLRQEHPEYPPLRIVNSRGIADDVAFCKAYIDCDILISDGKEFVHDSITHAIQVLHWMITSPETYLTMKKQVSIKIKGLLDLIAKGDLRMTQDVLDRVKTLLGAQVDAHWANDGHQTIISFDMNDISAFNLWSDLRYQTFWKRKYNEEIDPDIAFSLWNKLLTHPGVQDCPTLSQEQTPAPFFGGFQLL